MMSLVKKFGGNFREDKRGSVAIETSIILPLILIPMTLATVDVGLAINAGQSLTSASRSGSQYLLNGGDIEADLKGVIVDAYRGGLTADDISIATSCACPNVSALPNDSQDGNEQTPGETTGGEETETDAYELRNVTLETMDQCNADCGDDTFERVVVNMQMQHESQGLYKNYPLSHEISVRVK